MNSIIKLLLILSTTCLLSCSNDFKNLIEANPSSQQKSIPSIFKERTKEAVFNTSFEFKDYFASGLMVIKSSDQENFRIVFTTKMGQKLLDTELSPENFKINYVVKQLDRKLLLKLLEKDLRMVCEAIEGEAEIFSIAEKEQNIFRFKTNAGFRYFYYSNDPKKLHEIARGSKRKKKVVVQLQNYHSNFPERITFAHQNLPLKIEMKLLNR